MKNTKKKEQDGGAVIPRQARPQGVRESLDHVEVKNAMPVLYTLTGTVGALATDVRVMIHKRAVPLSLIMLVVGDSGSGKSRMDEVFNEWAFELIDKKWDLVDDEKEWRAAAWANRNNSNQKEKPTFPMRVQTLNTTVANLAERLEAVGAKHAISYSPEIDTILTKWGRGGTNDFSTMLRLAYDGSSFEREAKNLDAANVHIRSLLWNCIMCGQPEALYMLMSNMTNGLLSRVALAKMHDNTYDLYNEYNNTPFTEDDIRRIHEVAHLLGLMRGTVVVPKLEARSIKWADNVCMMAAKDGNDVMARCRLRDHVTAYRMTVCLMLCAVAEKLISKYGCEGAEKVLIDNPDITAEMILDEETPAMLKAYDIIADYILDMDMFYFGEKLKAKYEDRNCRLIGECKTYRTANNSIFECLPPMFTREQLIQQCKMNNGDEPTKQKVASMLCNWKRQKLIVKRSDGGYKKLKN